MPQLDDQHWRDAVLRALLGDEASWIALRERDELPAELLAAIEVFEAGDRPAATGAAEWLRTTALDARSARTWVLVRTGRILGFVALASTQIGLSRRQREIVGSAYRSTPATLVAWIAKARDAEVDGEVLLRHADAVAQQVDRLQATCALVVDAFDDETGELWRTRYGFVDAPAADGSARMWLPLSSVSR